MFAVSGQMPSEKGESRCSGQCFLHLSEAACECIQGLVQTMKSCGASGLPSAWSAENPHFLTECSFHLEPPSPPGVHVSVASSVCG